MVKRFRDDEGKTSSEANDKERRTTGKRRCVMVVKDL
jgi:hypothetical protein